VKRWERFWFAEVPDDVFAWLRVAFGVLGVFHILALTPVSAFWAPDGLAPVPGGGLGFRSLLVDLGLGAAFGWALFLVLLVAFACMAAGLWSSWAVPIAFAGSVLQGAWNVLPLSGAHQVLVAVLFCLVWADCSGWPSVDAWRARRASEGTPFTTESRGTPIWPLRLIQFQIALIYLSSGLLKLVWESWQDGTALHYALSLNTYQRFPTLPVGIEWLLAVGTYLTLFWEIGFIAMVWHPVTRRIALAIGVMLHLGMWVLLEVELFSWFMMASYLAFFDPHWLSRALRDRFRRELATTSPA
jgi:hypothetical protein